MWKSDHNKLTIGIPLVTETHKRLIFGVSDFILATEAKIAAGWRMPKNAIEV